MPDVTAKITAVPSNMWEPVSASNTGRRYVWQATLFLICAAAFCLVALVSLGIFERIPHVEDEAAYLFQAQVFAIGRLSVPTPPLPDSYWSPFVLDYQGQRFGKYPPGYPLLLSLGVHAGAPWIINAMLGSLALWFIAQFGREVYSPTTGLLAAALCLSCPVFLAESSSLLSHPASLLLTILFLWSVARLIRAPARSPWPFALVAGLALGYMVLTRPFDALGVGLPFALYGLARVLRGDRHLLSRGAIAAIIVLLFGLILLAYWYRLTGDFANPYQVIWPYDRPGFGPEFGLKGHTLTTGLYYARYNLSTVATGLLGWPGYLNVFFLWLPFVFQPRARWNYLLLGGFVSVASLHVTYWYYGGHDAGFPRYYYAALPMLLLLSARGIEALSLALKHFASYVAYHVGKQRRITSDLFKLPVYLTLIAFVLYNGLVSMPPRLSAFQGKSGITAAPLRVVQDAGITKAIVFIAGYEHWYDFAVFFAANSPTLDSDVVYAIYQNEQQARGVAGLYPNRRCYIQRQNRLLPCPF
jgi:4-amino-4-deoxy-L-arabinose transferase-like glycosyltransferase